MTTLYRLLNRRAANEWHEEHAMRMHGNELVPGAVIPPPASTPPPPPPPPSGRDPRTEAVAQLGPLCRCLPCCCRPGRGHNHPDFEALYERLMKRLG